MIPIKIQCGCGQRYAFDVDPVEGRMPYTVACPGCGMDGTQAANESLAQNAFVQPATIDPVSPTSISAPNPRSTGRPAKQIDILKVTNEARAKAMWGDSQEDVVKFLMLQGMSRQESQNLSKALFAERTSAVRGNGIGKLLTGVGLMCVPVATFLACRAAGYLPLKLLGIAGVAGLWGVWRVINGTIMLLAPRMDHGDVGSQ